MIVNDVVQHLAVVWDAATYLAYSQPLGAIVVAVLVADALLSLLGAAVDRWERGGVSPPDPASRKASAPPACGRGPVR